MALTFFANLNGSNCKLNGQTLLSLSVTEGVGADYDTASAVCLASTPYPKGTSVQTYEGGVSTGYWEVDDPVIREAGKNWKTKSGGSWAPLGMVAYRLRRKGWLKCRATMSKGLLGADKYPLKFCSVKRMNEISKELSEAVSNGEMTRYEAGKIRSSWHPVAAASDIIGSVCATVGQPVAYAVTLDGLADEYIPVDKPLITIVREVASWSGASVHLDRNGTLIVYDWMSTFSGHTNTVPALPTFTEIEYHNGFPAINCCMVIGSGRDFTIVHHDAVPEHPAARPGMTHPAQPAYDQTKWGPLKAIEVREKLTRASGETQVTEKIEIRDYPLTTALASKIARERLAQAALEVHTSVWSGPAEGAQGIQPLYGGVISVTRNLDWNGSAYRYFAEVTVPWGDVSFA